MVRLGPKVLFQIETLEEKITKWTKRMCVKSNKGTHSMQSRFFGDFFFFLIFCCESLEIFSNYTVGNNGSRAAVMLCLNMLREFVQNLTVNCSYSSKCVTSSRTVNEIQHSGRCGHRQHAIVVPFYWIFFLFFKLFSNGNGSTWSKQLVDIVGIVFLLFVILNLPNWKCDVIHCIECS